MCEIVLFYAHIIVCFYINMLLNEQITNRVGFLLYIRQLRFRDALFPVAQRVCRIVMRFNQKAVRPGRNRRKRYSRHIRAIPGGMRRVKNYRQVGLTFKYRDRADIRGVPLEFLLLERTDAPQAQNDIGIAVGHDILGRPGENP